jgi:hypothetical protein
MFLRQAETGQLTVLDTGYRPLPWPSSIVFWSHRVVRVFDEKYKLFRTYSSRKFSFAISGGHGLTGNFNLETLLLQNRLLILHIMMLWVVTPYSLEHD